MTVADRAPGIFTADQDGIGQMAVLNQDGSVNSQSNPAARGSIVSMWVTGMGPFDISYEDGEVPTTSLGKVTNSFVINLLTPGQFAMGILYAGQAPEMVAGVVQINARIPADAPASISPIDVLLSVSGQTAPPYDTDFAYVGPLYFWIQ